MQGWLSVGRLQCVEEACLPHSTPYFTPTCMSLCGFQSLSNMTTVSAVARLMPTPPARVDSRNTTLLLFGALKESTRAWRTAPETSPAGGGQSIPQASRTVPQPTIVHAPPGKCAQTGLAPASATACATPGELLLGTDGQLRLCVTCEDCNYMRLGWGTHLLCITCCSTAHARPSAILSLKSRSISSAWDITFMCVCVCWLSPTINALVPPAPPRYPVFQDVQCASELAVDQDPA